MPSNYKSLISRPILNLEDAALALRQYRSGIRENYGEAYIKSGSILGSEATTSNDLATVTFLPTTRFNTSRLNPDGIIQSHNHPGDVQADPSMNDIMHNALNASMMDNLWGHIVYNDRGTTYSFLPTAHTPSWLITPEMGAYETVQDGARMYRDLPLRIRHEELPWGSKDYKAYGQALLNWRETLKQTYGRAPGQPEFIHQGLPKPPKSRTMPMRPMTPPTMPSNRY